MPDYTVTHPTTGKTVTISGPTPPTEADLDQIFAATTGSTATPAPLTRTDQVAKGAPMTASEKAAYADQRAAFMKQAANPAAAQKSMQQQFADQQGTPKTAGEYGTTSGEVDGVPKWGRDHPNLYAMYKTATGGIDVNAPTAPATGVGDFVTRVVPESAVKTAVGVATAPYNMIKNVTDPVVNYAANITGPSASMQLASGIDEGMQNNIKGAAAFMGKPLGFAQDDRGNTNWSLANAKNAWSTDPVGSALAFAPEVGGAKSAAADLVGVVKNRVPNVEGLNAAIDTGITKAIRPGVASGRTAPQAAQYAQSASNAVKEIVLNKDNLGLVDEAGEPIDGLPQNLQQFRQAIDSTKKSIWDRVQTINKAAGGQDVQVPLQPAVDQLNDLASKDVYRTMAPETAAYAANKAGLLKQQGAFTVDDAQNAITMANQSLKNFYANPSTDTASRAYVDSLIANNLRSKLDSALETATGSAAAPELRKAYGDLKAIEKDVNQRATVDARKNNKGLIDFSDIYTAGELVKAMATLNPAVAAKAGVMATVKSYIKRQNDPNTHVKNVFQAAAKLVSPVDIPAPAGVTPPPAGVPAVQGTITPEIIPPTAGRTNFRPQPQPGTVDAQRPIAGLLPNNQLQLPASSSMIAGQGGGVFDPGSAAQLLNPKGLSPQMISAARRILNASTPKR